MDDQTTEQGAGSMPVSEKTKKTLTNKQKIIGLVVIIVLIVAAAGNFSDPEYGKAANRVDYRY